MQSVFSSYEQSGGLPHGKFGVPPIPCCQCFHFLNRWSLLNLRTRTYLISTEYLPR